MDRWRARIPALCLAICLLTALMVTFCLYPGWLFFDSATQWGWAREIANKGLPDQLRDYLISSHWPIANTLLRVPFYWLTGEVGFYALVQAAFFNVSMYLVGRAILGRYSCWLVLFTLLMVLSPVNMNYSVFQSSDTVVAACALVIVAMIADRDVAVSKRAVLVIVCALLMSLVRYNALPAALLLVCVFSWAARKELGRQKVWFFGVAVIVAICLCIAGMRKYEHHAIKRDSVAEGVVLRLVDASHHVSDPRIDAAIAPFVRQHPALLQPLEEDCYVYGVWCDQFKGPPRHLVTHKILQVYFHLMLRHPLVFLRVNYRFSIYTLGLARPLEPKQLLNPDVPVPFPAARMTFNGTRFGFLAALQDTLGLFGSLAARSGILIVLGLAASLLLRRFQLLLAFAALLVGYLAPLLVLVATSNFRYTFPVAVVGVAILLAGCCVLVRHLGTRMWVLDLCRRAGSMLRTRRA